MNLRLIKILAGFGQLLAAAIWGFAFVVVKDSLNNIGPIWMVAIRFIIAAILLAIVYQRKLKLIKKETWIKGIILGFFLGTAYITQTIGCKYTTAGKNAFLTTVYVVLIPLFSWIITKKRPQWYIFFCAIMSIVGIGLLALKSDDASVINKGDVLTLICGIFFAIHIIFTSIYNQSEDPVILTVLQFLFAAILGWLCAPFLEGPLPIKNLLKVNVSISILYLALFSTLIAFLLQNVGLKFLPPTLSSLFLSFEAVFGVIFGAIILREYLTIRMIIGCILIFLAVVFSQIIPEINLKIKGDNKNY